MFRPWLAIKSLAHLDVAMLKREAIRGLVLDADDTLCGWHRSSLHPAVEGAFKDLRDEFRCVVFSNRRKRSRHRELEGFGLPVVEHGYRKPGRGGYRRACELLGLPPEAVAAVGDRLVDVVGANNAGLKSILVEPLDAARPVVITMVQYAEGLILRRSSSRGKKR